MNNKKLIAELTNVKSNLETKVSDLDIDLSNEKDRYTRLENESVEKYSFYEKQISDKDQLIESQKIQLDINETKKLALAYKEQEGDYKKDIVFWGRVIACIFIILLITVWINSSGEDLHEMIRGYAVDLILIASLWFASVQYSNYVGLRSDYANRKTLAQSFNNILNNLQENTEIKEKFIEKTTDILCAPISVSKKDPILSKEVFNQIIEITKAIKG